MINRDGIHHIILMQALDRVRALEDKINRMRDDRTNNILHCGRLRRMIIKLEAEGTVARLWRHILGLKIKT
jgi:hypothetical protein